MHQENAYSKTQVILIDTFKIAGNCKETYKEKTGVENLWVMGHCVKELIAK